MTNIHLNPNIRSNIRLLDTCLFNYIVAFLNSQPIILLIGLEYNGNIFGLSKDIYLLSKKNLDVFQQTLIHLNF